VLVVKMLKMYSLKNHPITQPAIEAKTYEIKPNILSLVQQNQFEGSTAEDSGLHYIHSNMRHDAHKIC
jgi:hypothetical protein